MRLQSICTGDGGVCPKPGGGGRRIVNAGETLPTASQDYEAGELSVEDIVTTVVRYLNRKALVVLKADKESSAQVDCLDFEAGLTRLEELHDEMANMLWQYVRVAFRGHA